MKAKNNIDFQSDAGTGECVVYACLTFFLCDLDLDLMTLILDINIDTPKTCMHTKIEFI